jgi:Protein of unknown function (DUF3634)
VAFIVVFGLVLGVGYLLFLRSQELFRISIRDGKQTLTRGYAPTALLNDFGAAVRGVSRGEVRAHKAQGGARLSFAGGIDAGVAQRLRNIFGLYPVARLRAPHIDKRQTASDVFTLAWVISFVRSFFR